MTRIIRVFPRRTRATPNDELTYDGPPPMWAEGDEVHVSCLFTWDIPRAEHLAELWRPVGPVSLGGPAYNMRGGSFTPGMYVANGYVITSRGCPNRCWFCSVWRREGVLRELPICDGWNVLDDSLLACSESHVRAVFDMLKRQTHPIDFSGGWEAARLQSWHVDLLLGLPRLKQVWFAYDTPDDLEPLIMAGRMLKEAGFTVASHRLRCYCLIGWPTDTMPAAESRLRQAYDAGFLPMAMLWRDPETGVAPYDWRHFQRSWARPEAIATLCRETERVLAAPMFASGGE